jgi:hypothetical protein
MSAVSFCDGIILAKQRQGKLPQTDSLSRFLAAGAGIVSFDLPMGCMIPSLLKKRRQVGICPLNLLVTAEEVPEFASRLKSRLRALLNP